MTELVRLASGVMVPAGVAFAEDARRPVMREIAATSDGRDITRGYIDGLVRLLPQDSVLLERGGGDYELYRQVLSDIQVRSVLQQRQLGLTRTEWVVLPGGDKRLDKQAAKAIEGTLSRIRWDAVCAGMQMGVFYGHAVAECLWGRDGTRITLEAVKVRDRRRFVYDGQLRLRLRTMRNSEGEVLPERKFWSFCTGADHDDEPYGLGLAHWLYWPVLFKRANIKFWLIAGEKFGSPTAIGHFPPNATQAEQMKLLATLQAIQTDAGLILPEEMKIDLLESTRSGSGEYEALCRYLDNAMAKLVLGQVMTSEAVGGQYKAEVQDQVKDDIVKADADLLCDSFNRGPVRWLTDWNWPGAAYPTVWRQTETPEDLGSRAERDARIFQVGYRPTLAQVQETYGGEWEAVEAQANTTSDENGAEDTDTADRQTTPATVIPPDALNAYAMGIDRLAALMPIPARHIRQLTGIPAPNGGEAVLQTTSGQKDAQTGPLPPETSFAEPTSPAAQALIDAEATRNPGWDTAMEALLAPLFNALEEGLTPEEILGRMDEWYSDMNDAALIALLDRAMAAAETIGRLDAQN